MKYTLELQSIVPLLKEWIREKMKDSGGSKAILGISGGKDSSVTAAITAEALGAENVIGISMPNGYQHDIDFAKGIAEHLGIEYRVIDIQPMYEAFHAGLTAQVGSMMTEVSRDTVINLPARIRMTLLYAVSQSVPGARVINTSNLSEDWVGYATIYGDTAGAFSPLGGFTTDEVIEIGRLLQVPEPYLVKPPEDGLTGKTDEEKLGFTYAVLNRYIRDGVIDDVETKKVIDRMHAVSRFKFKTIPMFPAPLPVRAADIADVYPW